MKEKNSKKRCVKKFFFCQVLLCVSGERKQIPIKGSCVDFLFHNELSHRGKWGDKKRGE